jgi:hypothetical protein
VITPTHLTPDVLDQLREADAVVNEELLTHDLMRKISQVPVVLVPLPMDQPTVVHPPPPSSFECVHTHSIECRLGASVRSLCER